MRPVADNRSRSRIHEITSGRTATSVDPASAAAFRLKSGNIGRAARKKARVGGNLICVEPSGNGERPAYGERIVRRDLKASGIALLVPLVYRIADGTGNLRDEGGISAHARRRQRVTGRVGQRTRRLAEMPYASVSRPDACCRGGRRIRVAAIVHRDFRANLVLGNLHPDKRRSADVPGVDFVGEDRTGRINEHHVLARLPEVRIGKSRNAGRKPNERREVRQRRSRGDGTGGHGDINLLGELRGGSKRRECCERANSKNK